VSNLQALELQTGADWGWSLLVKNSAGTPLAITDPVMEMRRDLTYRSQRLARLDTTGQADGLITPADGGWWSLYLSSTVTSLMPPGRGFWDIFATLEGRVTRLAAGAINLRARVTEVVHS
jgi:hypothetical protein